MKLSMSILLFVLLVSCAGGDNDLSDEEVRIANDCFATKLESDEDVRKNFPGEWKLEGYACALCLKRPTTKSKIVANRDGSGFFEIDYGHLDRKESKEFQWEIAVNPTLRIETDPPINQITGAHMCSEYLIQNGWVNDGDLLIYKKQ